ncbi:hypothetical protein V8C86DRAFT_1035697 [Haematococcus lacustris]
MQCWQPHSSSAGCSCSACLGQQGPPWTSNKVLPACHLQDFGVLLAMDARGHGCSIRGRSVKPRISACGLRLELFHKLRQHSRNCFNARSTGLRSRLVSFWPISQHSQCKRHLRVNFCHLAQHPAAAMLPGFAGRRDLLPQRTRGDSLLLHLHIRAKRKLRRVFLYLGGLESATKEFPYHRRHHGRGFQCHLPAAGKVHAAVGASQHGQRAGSGHVSDHEQW